MEIKCFKEDPLVNKHLNSILTTINNDDSRLGMKVMTKDELITFINVFNIPKSSMIFDITQLFLSQEVVSSHKPSKDSNLNSILSSINDHISMADKEIYK